MSLLEKNTESLSAHHPQVAEALAQTAAEGSAQPAAIEIMATPSGAPTAQEQDGVFLHGRRGPTRTPTAR